MDTEEEWVEDYAMSPLLRAKLYALKVCRNRCLAHASSETAVEIARPVLKMFIAVLQNAGSLTAEAHDEYVSCFREAPVLILVHPVRRHKYGFDFKPVSRCCISLQSKHSPTRLPRTSSWSLSPSR